jgi:hypothetical protein
VASLCRYISVGYIIGPQKYSLICYVNTEFEIFSINTESQFFAVGRKGGRCMRGCRFTKR